MRPPDPTIMAPRSEVENVENTTDGFNHVRETAAGSGATEMGRRRGNQWRSVRQLRGFQGLSLFPRLFSVHAGLYGACICLCVFILVMVMFVKKNTSVALLIVWGMLFLYTMYGIWFWKVLYYEKRKTRGGNMTRGGPHGWTQGIAYPYAAVESRVLQAHPNL
eukprot:162259_1